MNDESGRAASSAEMCRRVAAEVKVLRRCIDWLGRVERGENVVVNLRLDADEDTEYVPFDHARVMRILQRIASDLEGLATGRPIPSEDADNPTGRHRRQLAEPQEQPKKLSTREERNALRAKLKLPPQ